MADTKTLQTRIALKYDSWENWKDSELVLLPGEIGLCAIPAADEQNPNNGSSQATTNPTVLFKVGDGRTPFKTLKWASALAADVHSWAKSETVVLEGEVLKFKTGETVNWTVDLSTFATDAVVTGINARLAAVEANFGTGTDTVDTKLANHESRLEAIEGDDGAIAAALTAAKEYTDTRESAITTAYEKYADQAETDANDYTDEQVKTINAKDAAQDATIGENTAAIAAEAEARAKADKAITDLIGDVAEGKTVIGLIADAQTAAADDAKAKVDALADGQVKANKADIAQLRTDLTTETANRAAADTGLDNRLTKVEAFFATRKDDEGNDIALDAALDTLVEIQEYLNGEGSATGGLIDRVAANEGAIDDINDIIGDGVSGTTLTAELAAVKQTAEGASDAAGVALSTLYGFSTHGEVKAALETVEQAISDNYSELSGNIGTISDLLDGITSEGIDATNSFSATVERSKTNAADIAQAKTDITGNQNAIAAINEIVLPEFDDIGDNTNTLSNSALRTDIDLLKATVFSSSSDSNNALREDLDELAGIVNNTDTGLAATKAIADGAASQATTNSADIAEIKSNYVRYDDTNKQLMAGEDIIIFSCGSATENITVPTVQQ